MSAWLVPNRTVGGTAVRAAGHALAATALAAGLHHAATDSRVSWPALAFAAAVLAGCAYAVLREGAPRWSVFALAAVQALLPGYLQLTGTEIPAAALDDHLRLPSVWHHNALVMAALNFLVGLALLCFFRSASELPGRLSHAVAGAVRGWWTRLLYVIGLVLGLTGTPLPQPARPPLPAVSLPRPHALTVLLHRAQPCAP
ncbi:hypothetical protein [Streptomyces sp. NPDC048825]|uniref:hypothetical protein n=1 Tax=Streptomyces sp. NPDC048825 TaxID=3365592 RepID=UPI0037133016